MEVPPLTKEYILQREQETGQKDLPLRRAYNEQIVEKLSGGVRKRKRTSSRRKRRRRKLTKEQIAKEKLRQERAKQRKQKNKKAFEKMCTFIKKWAQQDPTFRNWDYMGAETGFARQWFDYSTSTYNIKVFTIPTTEDLYEYAQGPRQMPTWERMLLPPITFFDAFSDPRNKWMVDHLATTLHTLIVKTYDYNAFTNLKIPDTIGMLTNLRTLVFDNLNIDALPDSIGNLAKLQKLRIQDCNNLTKLPDSIGNFAKLQKLEILDCKDLTELPNSIVNLAKLQDLLIELTPIKSFPNGDLKKLMSFELLYTDVRELPDIAHFPELTNLKLVGNLIEAIPKGAALPLNIYLERIEIQGRFDEDIASDDDNGLPTITHGFTSFPAKIDYVANVQHTLRDTGVGMTHLNLSWNKIKTVPNLKSYDQLVELNLSKNKIEKLPESIKYITGLKNLNVSYNRLSSLPWRSITTRLKKLETLLIQYNNITEIGKGIGNLRDTLQHFNFSNNQLHTLPKSFAKLGLHTINLSNNAFTSFPQCLLEIDQDIEPVVEIFLDGNQLTRLPDAFGNVFKDLEELDINDNKITTFPASFSQMNSLQRLDASNNRLRSMPRFTPPDPEHVHALEYLNVRNNPNITSLHESIVHCQELMDIDIRGTGITNIDILRVLVENGRLAPNRNAIQTDLPVGQPGWLEQDGGDVDAYEVHDAFHKKYKYIQLVVQEIPDHSSSDAINNIDGNTRLKDVIVIARDVLAPALDDEKAFEGDTETIKEKIIRDLTTLKPKVMNAKLDASNSGGQYANVVRRIFCFLHTLNEKYPENGITREYLSNFLDQSLNAYGKDSMSCVPGIRERLSVVFPDAIKTIYQQSIATFPEGYDGLLKLAYWYHALETDRPTLVALCGKWAYNSQGPKTIEGVAQYIADIKKQESRIPTKDGEYLEIEDVNNEIYKVHLKRLSELDPKPNFNCKHRDDVFIDPKDCEEGDSDSNSDTDEEDREEDLPDVQNYMGVQ